METLGGSTMKIRWLMLGVAVVCASATAQTQNPPKAQGTGAPPAQAPAKNTAPGQLSAKPSAPASAAPVQGTIVEDIVARVNDDIITTVDYQEALASSPQEAQDDCPGCSPDQLKAKTEEVRRNVLRDLIDQALLVQRAKDLGITVETDVVKELDQIRQQNKLPDLEALEKEVGAQGLNYDDFKNRIRDHMLVQEVVRREVQSKINLDHAEVQKYYDTHKPEFETPEMVYVREIFVSTKDKPEADLPKLKQKAEELRQRVLVNGDDFGELAKHFSDSVTAKQGGELGSVQPGQFDKAYDVVFKLNKNEMTPVIPTPGGFEILQVQEHYEAGLQPLDKVQGQIENRLTAQMMEPRVRAYLATLRQDSYVIYHPGYVDTAAVANSTPIVEEGAPEPAKKDQQTPSTQKKKKFLGIF
jgi:peptidyl-prolyl cis-trans isomerase SurA